MINMSKNLKFITKYHLKKRQIFSILCLLASFFSQVDGISLSTKKMLAFSNSVYSTSQTWGSFSANTLLANVHQWSENELKTYYDLYTKFDIKGNDYGIPDIPSNDEWTYNITYINDFWGVLANHYDRLERPSKLFVFAIDVKKDKIDNPENYLFPIVATLESPNKNTIMVFKRYNKKPIKIEAFIDHIQKQYPNDVIKINICNAYADMPGDICTGQGAAGYQDELNDTFIKAWETSKVKSESRYRISENTPYWEIIKSVSESSIAGSAIAWHNNEIEKNKLLKQVVAWPDYATINNFFKYVQANKIFSDPKDHIDPQTGQRPLQRTLSWQYPMNGCAARAANMNHAYLGVKNNPITGVENTEDNTFKILPRPTKVFAFGSLCTATSNDPYAVVTWTFHTAIVMKDKESGIIYVIDPSMDTKPVSLSIWMKELESGTAKNTMKFLQCAREHYDRVVRRFNICNGYGSEPSDICSDTYIFGHDKIYQASAEAYQASKIPGFRTNSKIGKNLGNYLDSEWKLQKKYDPKRDPYKSLVTQPSWSKAYHQRYGVPKQFFIKVKLNYFCKDQKQCEKFDLKRPADNDFPDLTIKRPSYGTNLNNYKLRLNDNREIILYKTKLDKDKITLKVDKNNKGNSYSAKKFVSYKQYYAVCIKRRKLLKGGLSNECIEAALVDKKPESS